MTLNDLTVNISNVNPDSLLSAWQWLFDEKLRPVLVTAMGDVFVQSENGAVFYLDTVDAIITKISENGQEFENLLQDVSFVTKTMFPSLIVALRKNNKYLKENTVYSYSIPLALGGSDDPDNIEVTDISVHFEMAGQLHEKIKNLTEGQSIKSVLLK
jgi:hypothetical protein